MKQCFTLIRPFTILFLLIVIVEFSSPIFAAEPQRELLWPDGAPEAKGDKPEDKPTLTIFLPKKSKANGTAVVICPGGAYGHLSVDQEGKQIAEWLNSLGVAGFVLEYRHRGRGYGHPGPFARRAAGDPHRPGGAAQWNVNPEQNRHNGFFGRRASRHPPRARISIKATAKPPIRSKNRVAGRIS